MSEHKDSIRKLETEAQIELKRIEANSTSKEVASKVIGKTAIPWIVLLVCVGVGASAYLEKEALTAVIGLASTAVMALIAMVTGITGKQEKEEKPEMRILEQLVNTLKEKEPMEVHVDNDKVIISKGESKTVVNK